MLVAVEMSLMPFMFAPRNRILLTDPSLFWLRISISKLNEVHAETILGSLLDTLLLSMYASETALPSSAMKGIDPYVGNTDFRNLQTAEVAASE
jgi:hypothetical protein